GVEGDGYTDQIGGLNAFFLLVDPPETYKLPSRPTLPSRSTTAGWLSGWGAALVAGMVGLLTFRQRRMALASAVAEPVAEPVVEQAPRAEIPMVPPEEVR